MSENRPDESGELKARVEKLENQAKTLKIFGSAIALAVLLSTGYGVWEVMGAVRKAKAAALAEITKYVNDEENGLPSEVEKQLKAQAKIIEAIEKEKSKAVEASGQAQIAAERANSFADDAKNVTKDFRQIKSDLGKSIETKKVTIVDEAGRPRAVLSVADRNKLGSYLDLIAPADDRVRVRLGMSIDPQTPHHGYVITWDPAGRKRTTVAQVHWKQGGIVTNINTPAPLPGEW